MDSQDYYKNWRPLGSDTIAWKFDKVNARTCTDYLRLLNERSGHKMTIPVEAWLKPMKALIDKYGAETVKNTLLQLVKVESGYNNFKSIQYLTTVLKNGSKK